MKSYVSLTALLSLLLTAGCADRGEKAAQNPDEDKSPAATQPADQTPAERTPAAERNARSPRGQEPSEAPRGTGGARANRAAPADRSQAPAAGNAAPRAEFREVTIPSGTALPLALETPLSSETAQVETPVRARLKQAVLVQGVTVLPMGATVSGDVTGVERAGRVKGRSSITFTFNQIRADNLSAAIQTTPITFAGEASKGEDLTKIGAGAVGGAIVGGIVGGGKGAAKGAAIGGAAGTGVVLATRGKEVELANGTDLAATLSAPLTIRVPVH